jgi:ribosomal protein S14
MSETPHAYVHAKADYTNTCQVCGRGRGSYLHPKDEEEICREIIRMSGQLSRDHWLRLAIATAPRQP